MSPSICLFVALATAAPVDSADQRAKRLYKAGAQAFGQDQMLVAIAAFEEAYRLAPRATVAFSAAQAYRLQYLADSSPSRLRRAIQLYESYLKLTPKGGRRDHAKQHLSVLRPLWRRLKTSQAFSKISADPATAKRTALIISSSTPGARASLDDTEPAKVPVLFDVEPGKHTILVEAPQHRPKRVTTVAVIENVSPLDVDLEPLPALIRLRGPSGSVVAVNGRVMASTPLNGPLEVPAGTHVIRVTKSGRKAFEEEVSLALAEEISVDFELETSSQRTVAYTLFAGAGALAIVSGVSLGLAIKAEQDANRILDQQNSSSILFAQAEDYDDFRERRSTWRAASAAALGGAMALGIAGTLFFVLDTPDASGGGVAVGGTF